jgi:hypothetical protein
MPMTLTESPSNSPDPSVGASLTRQGNAVYPNGLIYKAHFNGTTEFRVTAVVADLSLIPSLVNPANDKTFNNSATAITALGTNLLSLPWNQQPLSYVGATPRIWGTNLIPGNTSAGVQSQGFGNGGFQIGTLYRIKTTGLLVTGASAPALTFKIGTIDQTASTGTFTAAGTSTAANLTVSITALFEIEAFLQVIGKTSDTNQIAVWGVARQKKVGDIAVAAAEVALTYTETTLSVNNTQALDLRVSFATNAPTSYDHKLTTVEVLV